MTESRKAAYVGDVADSSLCCLWESTTLAPKGCGSEAPEWKESVDAFEADLRTRGRSDRTVGGYLGNVRAFETYYRDVLEKSGAFISST